MICPVNGNQATVGGTKRGGRVTNSGCHLDRHWCRPKQAQGTGEGSAWSLVSLLLQMSKSWTQTFPWNYLLTLQVEIYLKKKKKEKLQEKGHISHNLEWSYLSSSSLRLWALYLLGETVSNSWMVVHNTQSILCKKQQHDSVKHSFHCTLLKEKKIVSCTYQFIFSCSCWNDADELTFNIYLPTLFRAGLHSVKNTRLKDVR